MLLTCSATFAQRTTVSTRSTMTAAEFKRRFPAITDRTNYDMDGNVIDSVKAKEMIKSFDYERGRAIPKGQAEEKRVLIKVNHVAEDKRDAGDLKFFWPNSSKLVKGATLDLSPLAKHTDVGKLDGKALVLLFYIGANGYKEMYDGINDAVDNSVDKHTFEVLAITHLDYASAKTALKNVPILNAHQIVDAGDVTDFYETDRHAVIVVTNMQHQIIYAAKEGPVMAPRTLNKLLKEL